MEQARLLLGSFDLLNIGHLTQLNAVATTNSCLTAAVVSDVGVAALIGSNPFLPQAERSAVIAQLRMVDNTCITGPENRWALPDHDKLYVDAALWDQLTAAGLDIRHAFAVAPTRLPTNPALLSALSAA
jgi:glycerol-3-phosphate cytidylyltransferase-like family protein